MFSEFEIHMYFADVFVPVLACRAITLSYGHVLWVTVCPICVSKFVCAVLVFERIELNKSQRTERIERIELPAHLVIS